MFLGTGATPLRLLTIVQINVVVLTPLAENMPGPSANKPGDVYVNYAFSFSLETDAPADSIYAMNGKTVEIDNTDAEGRLILAGMS